jgi:hypothetical protein
MKFIKLVFKEIKNHAFDYLLFLSACVLFILAISIFKGERFMEFIIVSSFVMFYIAWGIYHHIIDRTLRFKVILEYVLIGLTALLLLRILILP